MIETLRQIKKEDIYFFYELANDPEVRKNSFSVRPILWEEHEKWFYKKLQAGGVYLYLIDETPVGQIRFDIEEKTARISYTVAAAYRGKGYGSKMLRLAEQRFQEDYPQITQPVSYTHLDVYKRQGGFGVAYGHGVFRYGADPLTAARRYALV